VIYPKLRREQLLCKAEQIQKIKTIFTQMTTLFIQHNFECHFVKLLSFTQQLFSSQLEINHMIQEPTEANEKASQSPLLFLKMCSKFTENCNIG
jgi:hypothetical protein